MPISSGYPLLGHSYLLGEEKLPGLGIAGLETHLIVGFEG